MDWKRKLSSRKFWVAVCGFATALLTAFNMGQETVKITAIIMAFGTLISYVVAEGFVDAVAAQNEIDAEKDSTADASANTSAAQVAAAVAVPDSAAQTAGQETAKKE